MSAEYSVEEVKLKRREHVAETSLYAMLTDLLKRIEADERAALDGVVPTVVSAACDAYTSKDPREQTVNRACMRAALLAVWPNPPAQAAQVDCPTCGGVDLSDLGVECVRCTSASTRPHSPDAADSGRVSAVTADIVAAALHEFNRWNGAEDERSVAMDAALHLVWPQSNARDKARLSERKTVHLWLNDLHIEREECGRPLCLLRRLRILCDRYFDTCEQLSFEIRKHAALAAQPQSAASPTEKGNGSF